MTSRRLLHLSLSLSLLLVWQKAAAQLAPADDFFNAGAQSYISNNIPAALEQVEMGLKSYPDDAKLKRLEQLLKQQQQQQQNKSQDQKDQKNQSQKSESKPDEKQSSDAKKSDEQKKAEGQKAGDQKKDEPKPDNKKAEAKKSEAEKQDKAEQGEEPPKDGKQMTPEEAKQLLDAQQNNEQLLNWKPQKPRDTHRPVKDW
jgi:Ca-activated chloride channel homolog